MLKRENPRRIFEKGGKGRDATGMKETSRVVGDAGGKREKQDI